MAVSNVDSSNPYAALNGQKTVSDNSTEASDRFLKLLVAQMQNQDPLSPMDNAQVTSQMAQISTVTGIDKLNSSVNGLSSQFMQMQALQSAALVGSDVIVVGNKVAMTTDGKGLGGFELKSPADKVQVEIKNAAGLVVDTINMGAASAGLNSFTWTPKEGTATTGLTFNVKATSGATKIESTPLMRDKVTAINTAGSSVQLELMNAGTVDYADVKAFN
jgi:flagellar basal-body rod modification protein FlgD